ncbi:uncharacterized protein [Equus caballus]|uniref:uncharacterized protein n=1 Tax=Equus caballus TaxID=9796 RepID=UPI0038B24B24
MSTKERFRTQRLSKPTTIYHYTTLESPALSLGEKVLSQSSFSARTRPRTFTRTQRLPDVKGRVRPPTLSYTAADAIPGTRRGGRGPQDFSLRPAPGTAPPLPLATSFQMAPPSCQRRPHLLAHALCSDSKPGLRFRRMRTPGGTKNFSRDHEIQALASAGFLSKDPGEAFTLWTVGGGTLQQLLREDGVTGLVTNVPQQRPTGAS